MTTPHDICPWCGDSFPVTAPGGKRKRFCHPDCKNAWHVAIRRLGEAVVHALMPKPGQLREWANDDVHDAETAPAALSPPPAPPPTQIHRNIKA